MLAGSMRSKLLSMVGEPQRRRNAIATFGTSHHSGYQQINDNIIQILKQTPFAHGIKEKPQLRWSAVVAIQFQSNKIISVWYAFIRCAGLDSGFNGAAQNGVVMCIVDDKINYNDAFLNYVSKPIRLCIPSIRVSVWYERKVTCRFPNNKRFAITRFRCLRFCQTPCRNYEI